MLEPNLDLTGYFVGEMGEWIYRVHFTTNTWKYPLDISLFPKAPLSHTVVWRHVASSFPDSLAGPFLSLGLIPVDFIAPIFNQPTLTTQSIYYRPLTLITSPGIFLILALGMHPPASGLFHYISKQMQYLFLVTCLFSHSDPHNSSLVIFVL